jgi:flagellar hook-associated protein 1 FlgK
MSNLFEALGGTSGALRAFQQALTVTQNNVANASTPGYAKQIQTLEALPFDPPAGLSGGVAAGPVASTRNAFAERAVQQHVTAFGNWTQQAETLAPLQQLFDVSGATGIPGALTSLYSSFSDWAGDPNSGTARAAVLDSAHDVAGAFQTASQSLADATASAGQQLGTVVGRINDLTAQLASANAARAKSAVPDAGLDAQVYGALEELSELVPVTALPQPAGGVTVLLNGQTPLVAADRSFPLDLRIDASGARILDATQNDVSGAISGGRAAGLLAARNTVIPSLSAGVDRLAQTFADRVNSLLTAGSTGTAPGAPLFAYDATNPGGVARSLTVDPGITAGQLAAIDPGPPQVANGVALHLADLATSSDSNDRIDGMTYTEFFGKTAGALGSAISRAQTNTSNERDLATQARDLRSQTSGVSLDEEAVKVLEFQRSYQAASKMITILDGLLQTVIEMGPR